MKLSTFLAVSIACIVILGLWMKYTAPTCVEYSHVKEIVSINKFDVTLLLDDGNKISWGNSWIVKPGDSVCSKWNKE